MGKAGKWIKSLLVGGGHGMKDKEKEKNSSIVVVTNNCTPVVLIPATPKDKKRWSFRRSSATKPAAAATLPSPQHDDDDQKEQEKLQDTKITSPPPDHDSAPEIDEKASTLFQEDAAAIKIQSVFRSYLARKALRALRGLVKIQALVRGHLVRKQATATLRCMQALVTAQARARAHRIRSAEQDNLYVHHRISSAQRMHNHDFNFPNSYQGMQPRMMEENIKIVEMDQGQPKPTPKIIKTHYSNHHQEKNYTPQRDYYYTPTQEYPKVSPAPSSMTDISPRTCSAHFEDYSYATAQSSPQCYYSAVSRPDPSRTPFAQQDFPLDDAYGCPNYMANTQSSRAKARSQSAPKQRPAETTTTTTTTYERQLSRRRPSVERRNIPRVVRMQRSSSHVGSIAHNYQLPPWSVKIDKSTVSLRDSDCGSTCSAFTNANYCRTIVSYDVSTQY